MTQENNNGGIADKLRQRAEAMIHKDENSQLPEQAESVRLLHELQVHQIELEMQNEELRRAHLELSDSHSRYCSLYDHAPIGYLAIEKSGRIQEANLTASRMLDVPRGTLVSKQFEHFISSEDQEVFYFARQRLFATNVAQSCELRLTKGDGTSVWVDLTIRFKQGLEGESAMLLTLGDITFRRKIEATLLLKSRALEAATNAILITNQEGRIEWANDAYCALSGYAKDEIIGCKPGELVKSGKHDEDFSRKMWKTILAGHVWQGELINRRKDGSHHLDYMTITPVFGELGRPAHYIGVSQDISESKMRQEQLVHARKMEVAGQLACGVAHDFNNFLEIIILQAEAAEMGENMSEAARQALSLIRATASSASSLAKQLLSFGHTRTNRQGRVDADLVIGDLVLMLRPALGAEIRLELELRSSSVNVMVKASALEQLVTNLVINARDAMPDGGSILIETSLKDFTAAEAALIPNVKAGCYLDLRVVDTGAGMEPAILAKIFEPFFTTKEPGKGTGLGLSTVYAIVQQHQGSVQVKSVPGLGTSFRILLPACEITSGTVADEHRKPEPVGGNETILLVEDQPSLLKLLAGLLERHGYRVLAAANGEDALDIWESCEGPIHLLMTDLMMSEGISGQSIAEKLLKRDPRLRILFTSGSLPESFGNGESLPARQAFIQKPVAVDELVETIRVLIDG
jgi:PAS domain S-box-containing protein